MTNNNLIFAIIALCSLSGWYVVLTKYLELKAMIKNKSNRDDAKGHAEPLEPVSPDFNRLPENFEFDGQHIPGMGPPPNANLPFNIPEELLAAMRNKVHGTTTMKQQVQAKGSGQVAPKHEPITASKRVICNWAAMLHLSGLVIVFGVPFLNIIAPAVLWLLNKERHPFLAKQGREVINFQITFTLIQFLFLGLGVFFIWFTPNAVTGMLAWTKTLRVVFSTGLHVPYNMFTVVPFYWGCIVMVRGAVSAYNGMAYKYPYAKPFIFEHHPIIRNAESVSTTAPISTTTVTTKTSISPVSSPIAIKQGLTNFNFS